MSVDDEERPPKPEPPAAVCCELGRRLIVLMVDAESPLFSDRADFVAWVRRCVPSWHLVTRCPLEPSRGEIRSVHPVSLSFCPFCGVSVPDVEWDEQPPAQICTVIDGGYYCATCDERLMGCNCHPVSCFWKVKE